MLQAQAVFARHTLRPLVRRITSSRRPARKLARGGGLGLFGLLLEAPRLLRRLARRSLLGAGGLRRVAYRT